MLLAGSSFSQYLAPIFTGISVPHLSPEQIKNFRFALPPAMEQTQIVEWITRATIALVEAIERAYRGIRLLREFRTRLIADVVTGKLDVREAGARFPEESEESEEGEGLAAVVEETIEEAGAPEEARA